ncbi:TIR domain-containing protein [Micromonospora phaseoli]|uniref:TIR domain-containing protein n=1 Tax=Micromonospora phaseoli TaxID=1144548 RepID=A0A1H7DXC1_9ACTN|nr:TIR-like protein FxsC [Micromonospora phaseoli]PZV88792.1 TIR domain-containing protein [Micromonospora phaseoli]GIJ81260.1 hypothetical protein Xph01_56920 [Micromonospora phaseoli]SEK06024.1 TIR domain-containing protein [Micromonospora phaseoli]
MYRALLVCNSVYEADTSSLATLRGPSTDGPLLRHALVDPRTGMFDERNVDVRMDLPAHELLDAASQFFADSGQDDTLLFYFSGHARSRHNSLFLCCRNTVAGRLAGTAVSNISLGQMITDAAARTKIVLLDCCEAGAWKGAFPESAEFGEGSFLIAACPPSGAAADAERTGMPSPFTQALIDGLRHDATASGPTGHVDLEDLYAYVAKRLKHRITPHRKFDGNGHIPIARRPAQPAAAAVRATRAPAAEPPPRPFIDETTTDTGINSDRVARFRADLRPEITGRMPEQLTTVEFLQRANLLRHGRLTRAGALLFGDDPTAVVPTAVVQCTQVHGLDKTALMDAQPPFAGSVPEQIVHARDFVAKLVHRGEEPTEDDARAQPFYDYPMIAVREIIANALVHRDYEHAQSCVHVRVYADRIEVVNPGSWQGAELSPDVRRALGDLASESRRPNFRLAHILTWVKVVEGEGSGIPRALSECRRIGAPEPTVSFSGGMVIVTLYPREPDTSLIVSPTAAARTEPRRVAADPPAAHRMLTPVFYLSYARAQQSRRPAAPRAEASRHVPQFFDDLSMNVNELLGLPGGEVAGYVDLTLDGGERWQDQVLHAVGTCQVFISLLSPSYFASRWCAMEWDAFARRRTTDRRSGAPVPSTGFLPLSWVPTSKAIPQPIAEINTFGAALDPEVRRHYQAEGLYGLMTMRLDHEYAQVVWRVAMQIAQMCQEQTVEPDVPLTAYDLKDTFS